MSLAGATRYPPAWLALREPADAAARAAVLLTPLRQALAEARAPLVVSDLGCGTGAMARWLAPQLPGPQHWIMYDADPDLLAQAQRGWPAGMTVATRQRDLTGLRASDLAGSALITGSALLDLLTEAELDRLAATCEALRCPALLSLSVTGEVTLDPADPLDPMVQAAFNAHQRRQVGGRHLLGPAAVEVATAAFTRHGAVVSSHPSPWRLGPTAGELIGEWLEGWVRAACEQQPSLTEPAGPYLRRRLAAAQAGQLAVVVGHQDLLAVPAGVPR